MADKIFKIKTWNLFLKIQVFRLQNQEWTPKGIVINMTDYEEEQRNEIEAIESIYPEEFTSKKT